MSQSIYIYTINIIQWVSSNCGVFSEKKRHVSDNSGDTKIKGDRFSVQLGTIIN